MCVSQKEAEKKFINDSLVRWGCVYAIFLSNLLAASVRWHADLSLRLHFYAYSFCHAAAGFAIDRLERDGINKTVASPHHFLEALAVFRHGCNTKKYLRWLLCAGIFFCGACGVGYLT